MHFSYGINRPHYEGNSAYLQVTSGCSHNRCTYCPFYKKCSFAVSPPAEIEEDVKEIPRHFYKPERVFLQSADAFAASYDLLMQTAEWIHRYVPSIKSIGGYARIDNFRDKSLQQIRDLRDAGYSVIYIGIESGDDEILRRVDKGYTAAEAREQLEKLTEARLPFVGNFLGGLGGAGYGLSHAQKTAALYDGMFVSMIDVYSLSLQQDTPLWRQKERGEFTEAGEMERLEELLEFIRCLKNETYFLSGHRSVPFQTRARLPEQKEQLIRGIRSFMDSTTETFLQEHRKRNPGL